MNIPRSPGLKTPSISMSQFSSRRKSQQDLYFTYSKTLPKIERKLFFEIKDSLNRKKNHFEEDSKKKKKMIFNEQEFVRKFDSLMTTERGNLNAIQNIIRLRSVYLHYLRDRDLPNSIETLLKLMEYSIRKQDFHFLIFTYRMISETYLLFGELENSLYTSNCMRILCEHFTNWTDKINALILMSKSLKRLHQIPLSLLILKKALQWVWAEGFQEKELEIYEEMGILNYYLGNMAKALFYHEKALNCEVEDEESMSKKIGIESVENFKKTIQFPIKKLDAYNILKFNFMPFSIDEKEEIIRNNIQVGTSMLEETLLANVMSMEEFITVPPSPIEKKRVGQNEKGGSIFRRKRKEGEGVGSGLKGVKKNVDKSAPTSFVQKKFDLNHLIKRNTSSTIPELPLENRKLTLSNRMDLRLGLGAYLSQNSLLEDLGSFLKYRNNMPTVNPKIIINHLSPRRNMEVYKFSCDLTHNNPNKMFDMLISKQYYGSR